METQEAAGAGGTDEGRSSSSSSGGVSTGLLVGVAVVCGAAVVCGGFYYSFCMEHSWNTRELVHPEPVAPGRMSRARQSRVLMQEQDHLDRSRTSDLDRLAPPHQIQMGTPSRAQKELRETGSATILGREADGQKLARQSPTTRVSPGSGEAFDWAAGDSGQTGGQAAGRRVSGQAAGRTIGGGGQAAGPRRVTSGQAAGPRRVTSGQAAPGRQIGGQTAGQAAGGQKDGQHGARRTSGQGARVPYRK